MDNCFQHESYRTLKIQFCGRKHFQSITNTFSIKIIFLSLEPFLAFCTENLIFWVVSLSEFVRDVWIRERKKKRCTPNTKFFESSVVHKFKLPSHISLSLHLQSFHNLHFLKDFFFFCENDSINNNLLFCYLLINWNHHKIYRNNTFLLSFKLISTWSIMFIISSMSSVKDKMTSLYTHSIFKHLMLSLTKKKIRNVSTAFK